MIRGQELFRTASALSVTLLAAASCSPGLSPDEGAGGSNPLDEKNGRGGRFEATVLLRREASPDVKADFSGAFTATGDGAEYVRCQYGDDPENTGSKRLRVDVGHVGAEPVFEWKLKRAEQETGSWSWPSVADSPLSVVVRERVSGSVLLYSGSEVSSCRLEILEFDDATLAGNLACRDLTDESGDTLAATLVFECAIDGGVTEPDGDPDPTPTSCTTGSTEACAGSDDCSGERTCDAGVWGECECAPEPRLLLKLLPPAPSYETRIEQTDGSGLSATAASMGSAGYVITAGTANAVPYTLYGTRASGSTIQYETQVVQADGSGLAQAASSLAASGYLPTVGMAAGPYTLVGVRPKGSTQKYETIMQQTTGSYLDGTLEYVASSGYVPMIAMANSVPYTIIGVRPLGSTKTYTTQMVQTTGSGLSGSAATMANSGYLLIAAMANAVPYTLIGVKDAGETWTLGTDVRQTTGSGLDTTAEALGQNGFLVLTATANEVPYTLFGSSITE